MNFKLTAAIGAALRMEGGEIVICQYAQAVYVYRLISYLDVADLRRSWHSMMLPALENSYGTSLSDRHMTTEYAKGLLAKLQQFMATIAARATSAELQTA